MKVKEWIIKNKSNAAILLFVVLLFVSLLIKDNSKLFSPTKGTKHHLETTVKKENALKEKTVVVIFSQPLCKSCKKQKEYISTTLKSKYPEVIFEYHDITQPNEMALLKKFFKKYNINPNELATPATFINGSYMLGYENDKTSGRELEELIKKDTKNISLPATEESITTEATTEDVPQYIDTWFGKINLFELSLPMLSITLGYIDGFNPCTMWVLTYLISLVIVMNDKRKIWLIVGSFIFASSILYYLFMTAMLSVFLYIGYLRILELIIGSFALFVGIIHVKTYIENKGQAYCKVGGIESKKNTMSRIDKLVDAELSAMTVLGIIALAFVVNSIEFVCSAALPAIYTSILSKANLHWVQYHFYMLLYIFFFMFNEIIVFSFAAFAAEKYIDEKYIGPCKLIGGIILFILGVLLLFFPEMLSN